MLLKKSINAIENVIMKQMNEKKRSVSGKYSLLNEEYKHFT